MDVALHEDFLQQHHVLNAIRSGFETIPVPMAEFISEGKALENIPPDHPSAGALQ